MKRSKFRRNSVEVGYDSASAFSAAFCRRFGCSPTQYRGWPHPPAISFWLPLLWVLDLH
ncbi:MAG: hypothetical protein KIS79_06975 [Burkholderiales bacterium]|nr:hypothetical protein [Burkholderiales bacterium]